MSLGRQTKDRSQVVDLTLSFTGRLWRIFCKEITWSHMSFRRITLEEARGVRGQLNASGERGEGAAPDARRKWTIFAQWRCVLAFRSSEHCWHLCTTAMLPHPLEHLSLEQRPRADCELNLAEEPSAICTCSWAYSPPQDSCSQVVVFFQNQTLKAVWRYNTFIKDQAFWKQEEESRLVQEHGELWCRPDKSSRAYDSGAWQQDLPVHVSEEG